MIHIEGPVHHDFRVPSNGTSILAWDTSFWNLWGENGFYGALLPSFTLFIARELERYLKALININDCNFLTQAVLTHIYYTTGRHVDSTAVPSFVYEIDTLVAFLVTIVTLTIYMWHDILMKDFLWQIYCRSGVNRII